MPGAGVRGAEDRHRRDSERDRGVLGPGIVADQERGTLEQRGKLPPGGRRRERRGPLHPIQAGARERLPSGTPEPDHVRLLVHGVHHGGEPLRDPGLRGPAPRGETCHDRATPEPALPHPGIHALPRFRGHPERERQPTRREPERAHQIQRGFRRVPDHGAARTHWIARHPRRIGPASPRDVEPHPDGGARQRGHEGAPGIRHHVEHEVVASREELRIVAELR